MDNFVTTIFKILGYFPISIAKKPWNNLIVSPPFPNKTKNKSTLFWTNLSCAAPVISFSFLVCSVLTIFFVILPDIISHPTAHIRKRRRQTNTFYAALILKCILHIFTASFVKVGMFLERKSLTKLYKDIHKLSMLLYRFNVSNGLVPSKTGPKTGNRFSAQLLIQILLFLTIISVGMAEIIYNMLSQPGVKFPFVFVYCAPVGLGYFHSIFSFVLVYTLNWFLELLLQIKVMVEWEREQILGAEFLSGVENFEIQSIMNFYAFLHQQVKCFNKLFGIWVTIDMIHSIARIIFSSYFLATQTNYATLNGISGTVHDFMTVGLYFYIIYAVCTKASELVEESGGIVKDLNSFIKLVNQNKVNKYQGIHNYLGISSLVQ